jgi:hypothetical protein
MVTACLISTTMKSVGLGENGFIQEDTEVESYDTMDGPSEEEAYLQGKQAS